MSRVAAALALIVLIALLGAYGGLYAPGPTLDECLADPDAFDGAVVYAPRESVIGRVTDDGFTLRWRGREVPVRGIARHARPGTYVGVRGRFRRGGWIEAEAVHVGRWRRMKMAVSIAAAAAVAVMLRRRFRWDREQRGFASR